MYSDNQLQSLRKKYNKTFWSYIGLSVLSMAAAFLLVYSPLLTVESLIPWLIAAGVGLVLAAVEYAAEQALYKRGKKVNELLIGFVLCTLLLFLILDQVGALRAYSDLLYPVLLGFLFNRTFIPALTLLWDYRRLKDGEPCETVGRMKEGSRRWAAVAGISTYLLFEDELTSEVHLLLIGSIDPARRYRVLYLPHSGLAVGEAIPDDVEFDPFGNPIERDDTAAKPADPEDSYADKPDYSAPDDTEPPHTPPTPEELDPNSPARKKAAQFTLASKVCIGLCIVSFGLMLLIVALSQGDNASPASFVFAFLSVLIGIIAIGLSEHFKKQDRKLRCTRRTTARCIDTVRRKSGKYSSALHPIVGYEVNGVSYTVELPISCTRDAVGELYPIYYDPLDPESARVG